MKVREILGDTCSKALIATVAIVRLMNSERSVIRPSMKISDTPDAGIKIVETFSS